MKTIRQLNRELIKINKLLREYNYKKRRIERAIDLAIIKIKQGTTQSESKQCDHDFVEGYFNNSYRICIKCGLNKVSYNIVEGIKYDKTDN